MDMSVEDRVGVRRSNRYGDGDGVTVQSYRERPTGGRSDERPQNGNSRQPYPGARAQGDPTPGGAGGRAVYLHLVRLQ